MRLSLHKSTFTLFPLLLAYLGSIPFAYALKTSSNEIEDFKQSWTSKALKLQREIDLKTPLNEATFIGTHNSYNSKSYQLTPIRYIDPNQILSLYNQLEMGVRSLEIDTHWTLDDHFTKNILLCHARDNHIGCGIYDRKVGEGLEEIRNWLRANPKEIVLLYIERHLDGHEPRLAAELDKYLGEFIFKPSVVRKIDGTEPKSCVAIPGSITKEDVLKAGKQLVIVTKDCDGNRKYEEQDKFPQIWNDFVFAGIGNIPKKEYTFIDATLNDFTHFPDCGWSTIFYPDINHSSLWRIFEDRTILSGVIHPGQKKIQADDMSELMQCGINWPTMDMLAIADSRLTAAIWSWAPSFPDTQKGHCAIYKKGEGIQNIPCSQINAGFACRDESTHQLKTITLAGKWEDGESMCQVSLGKTWHFAMPVNGYQMYLLKDAIQLNGLNQVWLNYAMNKDGEWRIG